MTVEQRAKSRVIVVDESGSVLLFRTRMDRPGTPVLWITPGGHAEPGETPLETAIRELAEETGLAVSDLRALPVAFDYRGALGDGTPVDYHEDWFLLRAPRFEPDQRGWTEEERTDIVEHRWWSLVELAMTSEPVDPPTLIWTVFDSIDPEDLGELARSVSAQEATLRVDGFDQAAAWRLGSIAARVIQERAEPLVVEIRLGEHAVFKAAFGGVSVQTDPWLAGKSAVARHYGRSSLSVGLDLRRDGRTVADDGLDDDTYRAHGGSVPIIDANDELLGTITVSGAHQLVDHAVAVAALEEFAASA